MYTGKQRLLTLGPTPLYQRVFDAMMAPDIRHRTEDFRDRESAAENCKRCVTRN
jgi:aspartate aminotransferase-like enzyme